MSTNEILSFASIVGIIVGMNEVFKKLGMNEKYAPLTAVVMGVSASVVASLFGDQKIVVAIFVGLAIGLTSVGLLAGVKNTKDAIIAKSPFFKR